MQEYTVVTVIKDNVVDRLEVFVNNEEAESHFLEECEKEVNHFNEYSYYHKQELLDQGYALFSSGSVCISHPG